MFKMKMDNTTVTDMKQVDLRNHLPVRIYDEP